MADYNLVVLVGHLGQDPELRVTPKGTAICTMSLAVNREFKDGNGATRKKTTWIPLEAWANTADICGKYLQKGSSILVEGELDMDEWEDKTTGKKRSRLKVKVDMVKFLDKTKGSAGREKNDDDPTGEERPSPPSRKPAPSAPPPAENLDEDVPF